MGFRRFLIREMVSEPLTRLAELRRTEAPPSSRADPTPPNAPLARETMAAPLSLVSIDKKPARTLSQEQQKKEPPDPRNFAVWKRQQSPGVAGLFDRKF